MPIINSFLCYKNTKEASEGASKLSAILSVVFLVIYLYTITSSKQWDFTDLSVKVYYVSCFVMLFVYSIYFIISFLIIMATSTGNTLILKVYIGFIVVFEIFDISSMGILIWLSGSLNGDLIQELILTICRLIINVFIFIIVLSECQRHAPKLKKPPKDKIEIQRRKWEKKLAKDTEKRQKKELKAQKRLTLKNLGNNSLVSADTVITNGIDFTVNIEDETSSRNKNQETVTAVPNTNIETEIDDVDSPMSFASFQQQYRANRPGAN